MAIDKAVDSAALDATLTDIADAVRSKSGEISGEITGPIALEDLAGTIRGIVSADDLPRAAGHSF